MPAPTSSALLIASSARTPIGRGGMRVSDAERRDVADQLAEHYTEGRLDQEEFDRRLDQAMTATTYRDLAGLLHDLPQSDAAMIAPGPVGASAVRPPRRRRRTGIGRLVLLVLLVLLVVASLHAITWLLAPVLWVALICAIVVLLVRRR